MHSIGNAVKAILESGRVACRAFLERRIQLPPSCEEALRFDPPLHFFDRYALEAVEVAGIRLRKGEKIGLLLAAANRDPSRWPEPDRFDPARPLLANVAFGAGIHFCIGAPLARLEMQVALPILFPRLPQLRLAGTAALSQFLALSWAGGATRWRGKRWRRSGRPRQLPLKQRASAQPSFSFCS